MRTGRNQLLVEICAVLVAADWDSSLEQHREGASMRAPEGVYERAIVGGENCGWHHYAGWERATSPEAACQPEAAMASWKPR